MLQQLQTRPKQGAKSITSGDIAAFLALLPAHLSKRTYQVKKATGRHCTPAALMKYTRELFVEKYKIPFESLPQSYQIEIQRMVDDCHYGMKAARA